MNLGVGPQVATFGKAFRAHAALKRLLSRVSPHVNLQRARPHESLATLTAFKWSLASVSSEVVRQVAMRRESPSTVLVSTLEGLFAVVDPLVGLQVTLFRESLVTARKLTHERLFSDLRQASKRLVSLVGWTYMRAFVDFETACARVTLAANFAHKGLVPSVDQLVRLQVALRDKALATVSILAAKGSLSGLLKQYWA